MTDTNLGMTMV